MEFMLEQKILPWKITDRDMIHNLISQWVNTEHVWNIFKNSGIATSYNQFLWIVDNVTQTFAVLRLDPAIQAHRDLEGAVRAIHMTVAKVERVHCDVARAVFHRLADTLGSYQGDDLRPSVAALAATVRLVGLRPEPGAQPAGADLVHLRRALAVLPFDAAHPVTRLNDRELFARLLTAEQDCFRPRPGCPNPPAKDDLLHRPALYPSIDAVFRLLPAIAVSSAIRQGGQKTKYISSNTYN